MGVRKDNAINLYLEGIEAGDARGAVTRYTGNRYTQHSTGVKDGVEGFVEFFEPFIERCPDRQFTVIRALEDGPYVFVQVSQNINKGEAHWLTTDLFDTDSEGRIIEHWDVISAFDPHAPSPTQIDGATDLGAQENSEPNKLLVREFLRDVMILGQQEKLASYIELESLITHAAADYQGLTQYVGQYTQVIRIIGEGSFVAAYCDVLTDTGHLARFDLFRIESGRICEHWVNEEPVPPRSEWANSGKY